MYFPYGETETAYLKSRDKKLGAVIEQLGHIDRTVDTDLFSSVVHHIIGQQISTKAQQTIWNRIQQELGEVSAGSLLAAGRERLQGFGMTFRKADYILDFARKVDCGEFDLDAVAEKSDAKAIAALSSLKGIGVWTAEMILLFCLQRQIFSASATWQFSGECGWCTATRKLTGNALRCTADGSALTAAWQAYISGP